MIKQRGLTLVELAIVLSIIGILVAAVIGGQSLIGQAKSKDVIAIVGDLRNGATYFKQRYKYLPGDWPYTANEIPNVNAATTVGLNGNGLVEGSIDADGRAQAGSEVAALPLHLFGAGFLGKINSTDPRSRISTSFGPVNIVSKTTANGLVAGFSAANATASNAIVFFNLPCALVKEVDAKIDDANELTGRAIGTACANGVVLWYALVL
jgi:prepilin-type N-terminal cleavage/methylation domain-containing protein